ncbi:PTS sugar transporter [Myceligenerans crystallogenes]|uniref:PTS EIIB type-1 domain-containing protein n=1 Tax=Myceligenerans crystallogenes TaxID=316335 RepID=A0ABP4ZY45_9MICO
MDSKARRIVAALGGIANVAGVEGRTPRLRADITDLGKVDLAALRAADTHGLFKSGSTLEIHVGDDAGRVAAEIAQMR